MIAYINAVTEAEYKSQFEHIQLVASRNQHDKSNSISISSVLMVNTSWFNLHQVEETWRNACAKLEHDITIFCVLLRLAPSNRNIFVWLLLWC